MRLFRRTPRVFNLTEPHRLPVCHNEPPLREKMPDEPQMEAIREAREYLFQNTPQISRVDTPRSS